MHRLLFYSSLRRAPPGPSVALSTRHADREPLIQSRAVIIIYLLINLSTGRHSAAAPFEMRGNSLASRALARDRSPGNPGVLNILSLFRIPRIKKERAGEKRLEWFP